METQSTDFKKFAEDLRSIKNAIRQNTALIRKTMDTPMIRFLYLFGGAAVMVLSLLYYTALSRYGSYAAIPAWIQYSLIGAVILSCLVAGSAKILLFFFARRQDPSDKSLFRVIVRLFGRQALMLYPTVLFALAAVITYLCVSGLFQFIVPAAAIAAGVIFSVLGSTMSDRQFFFLGNWCLALGPVSIFFIAAHPLSALVWLAIILGAGMVLNGLMMVFWKKNVED